MIKQTTHACANGRRQASSHSSRFGSRRFQGHREGQIVDIWTEAVPCRMVSLQDMPLQVALGLKQARHCCAQMHPLHIPANPRDKDPGRLEAWDSSLAGLTDPLHLENYLGRSSATW